MPRTSHANREAGRAPAFPLGQLLSTPGALAALDAAGTSALPYLARHVRGDWGDVSADDARANDQALQTGARLLSAYAVPNGPRIWIITEAADEHGQRLATTVLLPEEY